MIMVNVTTIKDVSFSVHSTGLKSSSTCVHGVEKQPHWLHRCPAFFLSSFSCSLSLASSPSCSFANFRWDFGVGTCRKQSPLTRPLPSHRWRYRLLRCSTVHQSQRPRCQSQSHSVSLSTSVTPDLLFLSSDTNCFTSVPSGVDCDRRARPPIHEATALKGAVVLRWPQRDGNAAL